MSRASALGITGRIVMLSGALLFLGCESSAPTAAVSGVVTINNEAAVGVEVTFQPLAEDGSAKDAPRSSGVTDQSGRYNLRFTTGSAGEGALVGEHRVLFAIDEFTESPIETIPEDSRTTKFTVPPGGTEGADFNLN